MPAALADPCPECGFRGRGLTVSDLRSTIASLPGRWERLLDLAQRRGAEPPSEAGAVGALLDAIAAVRGGTAARTGRSTVALAAAALLAELDRIDDPWHRDGVYAAVKDAAHVATHDLRAAERRVGGSP